ncbi:MAG TPA: S53 family peptidase, partial [Acidimicrobiales bacterium]|nr:S53 family peptidase [Acidimicrobiales bacterium]
MDAYDDPALVNSTSPNFAASDLAAFDRQFHLPDPPSFTKLNQYGGTGGLPGTDPAGPNSPDGNWEFEEAMDVEWAHALAPGASIVLVEANSSSFADLYAGITTASHLPGVSTVSLSWGSSEFAGEVSSDRDFQTPNHHTGVTFVAAAGDGGAPGLYPAYSPNVVAVGGTTLQLNPDGSIAGQSAWSSSGGGASQYESRPSYQAGIGDPGARTIPDVAFLADRSVGVAVYDSYDDPGGSPWTTMGGTSLGAPAWAALIAIADQGRVAAGGTPLDGATQTLPALYSLPSADFHDITTGGNGSSNAGPGYDDVTGLGTPAADLLVPDLAFYGMGDHLVITAQPPASVTAGQPFGLTVEVQRPDGSLDSGASGNLTVSLGTNPGGAGLGGTLTAWIDQGIASFSGLVIDQAGSGDALAISG